jgi:hypothetical protein
MRGSGLGLAVWIYVYRNLFTSTHLLVSRGYEAG